ncbi:hypothetical protein, partial [Mesorhizobium sp. M0060]|uniref:hypothetical protein n=1 Tax=Mesorhizobium sp. M0060 TaxID=2956866 RepID=UPI0033371B6C
PLAPHIRRTSASTADRIGGLQLMSKAIVSNHESGGTRVKWTYTFQAKNRLTKFLLTLFVKSQWKGYMDVCLANVIELFAALPTAVPARAPGKNSSAGGLTSR